MDPQKHLEYTGVSNSLILENLKKLSEVNANIIGRIPIVPGMNDDRQSVEDIGEYLSGLNVKKSKYSSLPQYWNRQVREAGENLRTFRCSRTKG